MQRTVMFLFKWITAAKTPESSQDEYNPNTPKKKLNTSLGYLSDDWSPVKCILRKPFHTLHKSRKQEILAKSEKAIDTVLEQMAPEQGHIIYEELMKHKVEPDMDSVAIAGLQDAVRNANGMSH